MKTKKILGLDLGTNSLGWALIEEGEGSGKILGLGSRIVPMDAQMLLDFEKGKPITKNATRRQARGARRLLQRYKLRRNRLINTLHLLGWIPSMDSPKLFHDYLAKSPSQNGSSLAQFEIYELRNRALKEIVSLEELARILMHLNQRRGFLSNRKVKDAEEEKAVAEDKDADEDGELKGTTKTYEEVHIISVEKDESGKKIIYQIELADGRKGSSYAALPVNAEQKIELLITEKNTNKWGRSYFFQLPNKADWNYRKQYINKIIEESGMTVGQFYYLEFKKNPHFKVKDNIILRDKYIHEFNKIWDAQYELRAEVGLQAEMERPELLAEIASALYKNNKERSSLLQKRGLKYILGQDIIYYQRPLKSQKNSIGKCRYEEDKRVIPNSHPLYQEFRILDTINNLRVYDSREQDCTVDFIDDNMRESIYEKFNHQKSITPSSLKSLIIPKAQLANYTLSQNDDKRPLKGNETRLNILSAMKDDEQYKFIEHDKSKLEKIWHVLYSLDKVKDVEHALTRPKNEIQVSAQTALRLANVSFTPTYGNISARAINRLLPLMRFGNSWNKEAILKYPEIVQRINNILSGEVDDNIANQVREFAQKNGYISIEHFQAMPYWAAAYLVYGSHTSNGKAKKWTEPKYIELLPKNYLRNPIVQQVVNEALQLVKDIWISHGEISEIRIELARELKNSAKERESISDGQLQNRDLNNAIKRKLQELGKPESDADKYRIWLESLDRESLDKKELEGYEKYLKPDGKWRPAASDITKYKLWEEQHHLSPYTGKPIPLSLLFGEQYQIDHIIPRQRFYDDSLSNKVVVESFINADKGKAGNNRTAWEYITGGPNDPNNITILSENNYVDLVNRVFKFKKAKRNKLFLKEIPADFVQRQLKDTQYITKAVREELAKIVGLDKVHTTSGGITDHLREQWGIAHLFKELLLPRFTVLEEKLSKTDKPVQLVRRIYDENLKKDILKIENYSKRLDHRHHAADALVVACTKPAHIKRLNDLNKEYQHLRKDSKKVVQESMGIKKKGGAWSFEKPWDSFIEDSRRALEECVVSIKNRNRLVTKSVNNYTARNPETGKIESKKQTKGIAYGVRGNLHDALPFGETKIHKLVSPFEALKFISDCRKIDELGRPDKKEEYIYHSFKQHWQYALIMDLIGQNGGDIKKTLAAEKKTPTLRKGQQFKICLIETKYTKRVSLSSLSAAGVDDITNVVLREEIKSHIDLYANGDLKKAFNGDGVMYFNRNRKIPVSRVSVIQGANQVVGESIGKQQLVRKNSQNEKLHINTAGNLSFAIYENELDLKEGVWPTRRVYSIRSFYDALQLKLHNESVFIKKEGYKLFTLAKNDLVYVPEKGTHPKDVDWSNKMIIAKRLFNVTKFSGSQIYFMPNHASDVISSEEFGSQNCLEMFEGSGIKHNCIKVTFDRLGNITPLLPND
jgi:CRISPR-associated endonuclease Csn1